jgi:hypothetical protein
VRIVLRDGPVIYAVTAGNVQQLAEFDIDQLFKNFRIPHDPILIKTACHELSGQ